MKIINTATENIIIEGPVTADFIRSLTMHEKLSNFRSPARQQEALTIVAQSPEGLVYIAHNNQYIVGYTLFHYPSQYTRWSRHPRILELGAIEVARDYQKMGIAKKLLETAFENPLLEEYVVITTEFFWHWDLKGSRLDVWSYQKMLTKLFGYAGFKKRRTDDPEILEHPANMLMVRFGSKVPYQYIKAFEDLTYQNSLVD
ncbi:MAG: GNAT family N-acetyltransferase [Bacillota bacterium]|uniref:GNAT family N-acetyltransferase n=1 Tax=Desulfurispora thermophila TaxID=265470 RepID=UPI00037F12FB|nr:GNAT family N-acetyltransferase [Desulfurispora thermophila]